MGLSFKQTFILKGRNGQEAVFSFPYVNDNKELEFKYCSFFTEKVILNEEKQAIELQSKNKKIFILLRNENESFFQECMEIRKSILLDLRKLNQNFQSGKEPIYAIESGCEQYPFLITTPTVLDNGIHSVKYQKAIIYFVNQEAKKKGKNTIFQDYEALLLKVGQALKKINLSTYEKGLFGTNKYYSVALEKVVDAL